MVEKYSDNPIYTGEFSISSNGYGLNYQKSNRNKSPHSLLVLQDFSVHQILFEPAGWKRHGIAPYAVYLYRAKNDCFTKQKCEIYTELQHRPYKGMGLLCWSNSSNLVDWNGILICTSNYGPTGLNCSIYPMAIPKVVFSDGCS